MFPRLIWLVFDTKEHEEILMIAYFLDKDKTANVGGQTESKIRKIMAQFGGFGWPKGSK